MICTTEKRSIGILYVERNSINENPEYQRETAIWSLEKKQLFIDSLLNNYDIPKFYFHDLRNKNKSKQYAIIDGKQRLSTVFAFIDSEFTIATDFTLPKNSSYGNIEGNTSFEDFTDNQQERFKTINLDIVLVQNAEEDDIEELFSRLNNGEPLNAAEKRNAMGGDMCRIIRDCSAHIFFTKNLPFNNKRYKHFEIVTRFLIMEHSLLKGSDLYTDTKKKYLDSLVKENREMKDRDLEKLKNQVSKSLNNLNKVFSEKDGLLKKQSFLPVYYIFIHEVKKTYSHARMNTIIHDFLENFHLERIKNLDKSDEERDVMLMEFSRLSQQGTNDISNLKERVGILKRYLLSQYPKIKKKASKRTFSYDERIAVWIRAEKKCEKCKKKIPISKMEGDHTVRWSEGGDTTLENAQCLCSTCNKRKG